MHSGQHRPVSSSASERNRPRCWLAAQALAWPSGSARHPSPSRAATTDSLAASTAAWASRMPSPPPCARYSPASGRPGRVLEIGQAEADWAQKEEERRSEIREERWKAVRKEAFVHVAYERDAKRLLAELDTRCLLLPVLLP